MILKSVLSLLKRSMLQAKLFWLISLIFISGSFNHTTTTTEPYYLDQPDQQSNEIVLPKYDKSPLYPYYITRQYDKVVEQVELGLPKNNLTSNYIAGMSYFNLNQYDKSIPIFEHLLDKKFPIAEWLHYHLGVCYFYNGNYSKSLNHLIIVRNKYKKSYFIPKALELEGEIYLHQKNYDQLIKEFLYYKPSQEKLVRDQDYILPESRNLYKKIQERKYYFLGSAYIEQKNNPKAIENFSFLINFYSSAYTKKALKELSKIDKNYINLLSNNTKVKLCQFNNSTSGDRNYKKIIQILKDIPQLSETWIEYQKNVILAQSYSNIKQYKNAEEIFHSLFHTYSSNQNLFQRTEYHYARFLERTNRQKAIELYDKLIHYPKHPFMSRICIQYKKLISKTDINRMTILVKKALSVSEYRFVDELFFDLLNAKQYHTIMKIFPESLSLKIPNSEKVKILFWLGKTALAINDQSLALNYYKEAFLSYKNDYYTFTALKELNNLLSPKELTTLYQEDLLRYNNFIDSGDYKSKYNNLFQGYDFSKITDPDFLHGFYLMSCGEIRSGYGYILKFRERLANKEPYFYFAFSKMFHKMGLYQFAIRFSDFNVKFLNGKENRNYLPKEFIASSYPRYYSSIILEKSNEYKVDPNIIFAIVREESRFFSGAVSFAGAMGLMQLMPSTARMLARTKKGEEVDFYDQALNINLGTKYISNLINRHGLHLAVGGYNGGPNRVNRLYNKARKKHRLLGIEHFVELIPITETRNYIKKVLTSYYNYRAIYN